MELSDLQNVTFTSSGEGTLDGNGKKWWGIPGIGYLIREENRPRLLRVNGGKNLLIENIFFKNSPYWTTNFNDMDGLEIRHSKIDARRTDKDGHDIVDMTAFNTDGFDVSGKNVWIHDCTVWNQDDSVCVKGNSENMLFERINASGIGLTIGSIGSGNHVRNITFRDCYMHHTWKGIYMKFRGAGLVEDVTYENIVMDSPSQTPIWIGPAQQSDSREFWEGHPCSIFWPQLPVANCHVPADGLYRNITLRNITINNPKEGPGLIYGNETNPMQNIIFDNVIVNNPGSKPFGEDYFCQNVQGGIAMGNTQPVPSCFEDRTVKAAFPTVV
jgi:polygalacturonase